jgi:hypothetical protein
LIAVVEAGTRTRLDRKEFSQRLIELTGVLKHREVAYAPQHLLSGLEETGVGIAGPVTMPDSRVVWLPAKP